MKNNNKKISYYKKIISLYYKSTTPFTYIIFRWFILAIVVGLIAAGILFWNVFDLPVPPYIYVFIPLCILAVPLFLKTLLNSVYFFVSAKIIGKLLEKNWFLWLSIKLMTKSWENIADILLDHVE
ncbi:hypothetical protein [Mesomycoplasma ovipneumoniae]|uniref:Uncharacterized protein n=1 Tax=Mesomycoplasma ovipneumoniae TaxID=29562 RepID=A0AAP6CV47_9BACT|nr:hypothetical protein [Mesomycoplasma ovipneumoniae]MDW2834820.1 hypothetical protein [Mesomycoplasma ovipneumoniae]MDW2852569.1 hypothetical protein [Mesomycoplasma ovipneumoniae]MDW2861837.1 hypothetical protein [Mesomycoplasma ovipneumoniae]MDW2891545.1 hypothetical protein [Mesomycoplasma ovipneumoniae]MDW2922019.1 hypothetical protein [Mesomycoplasma ovipneumoniae]